MYSFKVEVTKKYKTDWAQNFMDGIKQNEAFEISSISNRSSYWLQSSKELKQSLVEEYAKSVLSDPVSEDFKVAFLTEEAGNADWVVEVYYLPGVTDNIGKSATEAICILEHKGIVKPEVVKDSDLQVYSGNTYYVQSEIDKEQLLELAEKYLANPLVQKINIYTMREYKSLKAASNFPRVKDIQRKLKCFDMSKMSLAKFNEMNIQRCLAFNEEELKLIQNYFTQPDVIEKRKSFGLGAELTEVELEAIAQTWSEHCKHKIFAANIEYSEEISDKNIGKQNIDSLYKSFIQKATKEIESENQFDWLLSVFKDNAGIVRFAEDYDLCIKVETHNSPSALDPYGGALTGILGVNRDIIGCGLGAKPVANMDVFCLSLDKYFPVKSDKKRPVGLLQPSQILKGVHKGVEDGGNKSGIPNVNGAIQFSPNYSGKPLIYVGCVGLMPHKIADGRNTYEKEIQVGDRIIVAGGRLGKDGIHGATFSSMELNETAPSTVVQIGDPITQKRLLDFTLAARDKALIRAITDNGAGGVSSSIGEMAEFSGGAKMDLQKHPVKYLGLEYFEMLISESQERMSYAVASEKQKEFLELAKDFGVEAFDLGEFTDSGFFEVYYGDKILAALALSFLHDAVPKMRLKAHWLGPKKLECWNQESPQEKLPTNFDLNFIKENLQILLASPNIASKESLIRSYDHEVQAATHTKYFNGSSRSGPNDSGVLSLASYGSKDPGGISIACGLKPRLSHFDTYAMTEVAIDEAIRNLIAVGTNPEKIVLLDNFCWPDPIASKTNPEGSHKLGQLVRSAQALYDTAKKYKAPFVSGKDSMKNDFKGKDQNGDEVKISVDPTLLITAMGKLENLSHSVSSDFKSSGDLIYFISPKDFNWIGSEISEHFAVGLNDYKYMKAEVNLDIYNKIYKGVKKSFFQSIHDVSDGGSLVCIAESCFGNVLGAKLDFSAISEDLKLSHCFAESTASFIVSINKDKKEDLESLFSDKATFLGEVTEQKEITITDSKNTISCDLYHLFQIWRGGFDNATQA